VLGQRIQLDPVERMSFALSAGAVAISYALAPAPFTAGLAAGAALEAINLRGLVAYARRLFSSELAGAGPWIGAFSLRFGVLVVGIFVVLQAGASPVGLLVGLSLAMPAVVISAILNRPERVEHELLPAIPPDDESWDHYSVWRAGSAPPPSDGDDVVLVGDSGADDCEGERE
jgi:hypothetical protein